MDRSDTFEFINPLILFKDAKYQFNKNLFNIPFKKYLKVSKRNKGKEMEITGETKMVQDKYSEIKALKGEKEISRQFLYLQVLQRDRGEISVSYSTTEFVEQLNILLKISDTAPQRVDYDEIELENIYINYCVNNTSKDQILKISTEEYYIPINSSFILLDLKYWNRIKWCEYLQNRDVV